MIPDDFKQQLLNRVDIVDVIERHVQLRKAGQNYVARCPFHNEKTPSFSVSPSKQFYHCFGCGAHGNAISFVMEHGGLGYVDAVKELAAMVGMSVPEPRSAESSHKARTSPALGDVLLQAARYYKEQLKHSEAAIAYLKERGLSGEMAARFGLGYAPPGWQNLAAVFADYASSAALKDAGLVIDADSGRRYDRFRDRVMFPITDQRGNVIGFGGRVFGQAQAEGPKYLNSPETALFQKGQELFGLFQARQAIRKLGRIVVVEGYMDVVSLHQHGVDYAVATLGTATTPAHVAKLLKLADELFFCFDGDAAGRKAAWRALVNSLDQLIDGKQLSFMFFPEGEDPDSYVRKCADSDVWTATPLSEFMVAELSGRVDLRTAEGRANLLELAKPLLVKVSAPAYALQLRRRFAQLADIPPESLDELLGLRKPRRPADARKGIAPSGRKAPTTLTRWLLQAVLNDPGLAAEVERAVLDSADPVTPALLAVLDLVAERPGMGSKQIVPLALELIQDEAVAAMVRSAQADLMDSPAVDVQAEFSHAIRRLREQADHRRLTVLRAKAERSGAEQAEFEQLLRALSQRAKEPTERLESRV